jgi:drug/metabolite transporter (DMT)-like permease
MKILLVWAVTCLIWSSVWLFIKIGLQDLPPISFAGLRLLIAVVILLPVIFLRKIPVPRKANDFLLIAVTGLLLLGVNYALVFWGAQYISSGLTAVLQAATPAFGLIFSTFYLPEERITFKKICAVIIGILGVAIIFSDQLQIAGGVVFFGCIAVVGGALCVAASYVLVKAHAGHMHPIALITGQMICGMIPLLLYGFFKEGSPADFRWTRTAIFSLLYLAIAGSIAAFGLNYWLLKRIDASKVMLMSIVQPLLAVLLGWLVLAETLQQRAVWGGSFIVLSIGLAFSSRNGYQKEENELQKENE